MTCSPKSITFSSVEKCLRPSLSFQLWKLAEICVMFDWRCRRSIVVTICNIFCETFIWLAWFNFRICRKSDRGNRWYRRNKTDIWVRRRSFRRRTISFLTSFWIFSPLFIAVQNTRHVSLHWTRHRLEIVFHRSQSSWAEESSMNPSRLTQIRNGNRIDHDIACMKICHTPLSN